MLLAVRSLGKTAQPLSFVKQRFISKRSLCQDRLGTTIGKHSRIEAVCVFLLRGVNAINVTMNNVYLQAFPFPATPGAGGAAAQRRAPGLVIEGGYKISFGGHVEGPTPVVLAQKGSVTDVDLQWTGGRTQKSASNPSGSPIHVCASPTDYMYIKRWKVCVQLPSR